MLPKESRPDRRRFRGVVLPFIGSSIALAIACSDSAVSPSVHGAGPAVVGPANDIQIAPTTAALNQGGRALLRCAAFDARGVMLSGQPSWTSSDASVVSVSSDGTVSAGRTGGANVTCQIGGRSATSAITVSTAKIAMVEVSPGAGILTGGGSLQLSGVARDSFGLEVPGSSIQWSSADTTIVTVSAGGVVTAKAAGDADIHAVSAGVAGMTRIKVSPSPLPPVASVTVSIDQSSLSAGSMAHAAATTLDANGQVLTNRAITWSVSNPAVISAFTTGASKANVRAIAQGTSVLTATSEGKSASVNVTVGAPTVASISTTLASPSITVGQTTLASAVPLDGLGNPLSGGTIAWSSLDPTIATVSSTGVVTGVGPGSVIIRASSSGVTGDAAETVSSAPVASVTTTLAATSLTVGQTTQASAVARDASGNTLAGRYVAWSSLNPAIATVSISGVVTAVAPGSAVIRATVESKIGDVALTANAPAPAAPGPTASVVVTIDSTSLLAGHTSQARFVAKDANGVVLSGKTPAWASQGTSIATVTSAGVVTGVSAGSTRIQATIDGIVGSAPLTVTAPSAPSTPAPGPTASVIVTIDSSSLAAGHTAQARFVAKDASGVVLTGKTPSWASQAPSIATVGSTGVVTGVSAGSTTIKATVDGIVGSAPLTVTVPSVITSPTPSGTGSHPNEPAGFAQLAFQSFDQLSNTDFAPGWNVSNYSIVSDAASPEGSTNAGQLFFHAGVNAGTAPGGVYPRATPFTTSPKSVYVSFWVKVSDPWQAPVQSGANKILYMWSTENGGKNLGSAEFLGFGFDIQQLQPAPTLENIVQVVDNGDGRGGYGSVALPINRVPYDITSAAQRGVWGHYEILMIMNTPGQADGTYKWWWNGRLYGDYSNRVRWTDTPGVSFQTVYWEPTYGGSTVGPDIDQWMRMKNLYISGK